MRQFLFRPLLIAQVLVATLSCASQVRIPIPGTNDDLPIVYGETGDPTQYLELRPDFQTGHASLKVSARNLFAKMDLAIAPPSCPMILEGQLRMEHTASSDRMLIALVAPGGELYLPALDLIHVGDLDALAKPPSAYATRVCIDSDAGHAAGMYCLRARGFQIDGTALVDLLKDKGGTSYLFEGSSMDDSLSRVNRLGEVIHARGQITFVATFERDRKGKLQGKDLHLSLCQGSILDVNCHVRTRAGLLEPGLYLVTGTGRLIEADPSVVLAR
jgi:hypothetical protein